uniref:Uncharacterized protein n=1 Tax=viral metagenome TaxID=1070528 RepID=A0A6C0B6Y6_9ZZZZ
MAQFNYDEVHVVSDSEDEDQYQWNGIYHPNFPNEWIVSHEPETGPEQCENCAYFGCYRGQFIGYCANCAAYSYKGKRGRGFLGDAIELVNEETMQWASVYETYLSHVEFARFSDELPPFVENEEYSQDNYNDDDDETYNVELMGQNTVIEVHFEGGYVDF